MTGHKTENNLYYINITILISYSINPDKKDIENYNFFSSESLCVDVR